VSQKTKEIRGRRPEHKENKIVPVKYFNMEEVNVTGFCNFCRNNIPLIITVSITLFFTYGIRLFWHSIGHDTELFMADKSGMLKWSMAIGRFGNALLSKLWYIKEFNPYTAFFTAFCLIWFFTISWCYIIAIFSRDTVRNNKLIPFALLFMTMPVWAEQFYYLLQAAENALIISLCPYIIYLLFKGFLDHEKGKIICAFILLVFITSVYQAVTPLFCCGVFACFVLLQEYSEYDPRVYRRLCLKLFITLVSSLAVYFFIDRIIIPAVFHVERSSYLDNMNAWGQKSIRENIINLFLFVYTLTVGHIPLVQNIMNPIIARHAWAGMQAAEFFGTVSRISGNVLLLPATVIFLIKITIVMRNTIPSGRRLLYMLAGIGIPLCSIIMALMGGSWPPMRSHYALPFASAFMLFYLIRIFKKKTALIVTCLSLLVAVYQAEITAQLFYSDQIRYNEDVRLANELNNLIMQVQPRNRKLPVALIGQYQITSRFHANFLQGDTIGRSVFGLAKDHYGTTGRGLSFMRSLGINFDMPGENQIKQAFKEAVSMPSYPDPGCVRRMHDYIVVRISETLYGYE
jgi:hypothetical protein